jgi:thioredoxin reductase (NADPH)
MSHYLIDQIKRTPNIRLRPRTEIERVEGEGRVEQVAFTSLDDGSCRVEEAEALFVFIGTRPRSDWLPPNVLRDAKGFALIARNQRARVIRCRKPARRRNEPGSV